MILRCNRRGSAAPGGAGRRGRRKVRAFTLIELMVAMGVLGLIVLLMGRVYSDSIRTFKTGIRNAEIDYAARTALDFIARDLSMAVFDYPQGQSNDMTGLTSFLIPSNRWSLMVGTERTSFGPEGERCFGSWGPSEIYFVRPLMNPAAGKERGLMLVRYFVSNNVSERLSLKREVALYATATPSIAGQKGSMNSVNTSLTKVQNGAGFWQYLFNSQGGFDYGRQGEWSLTGASGEAEILENVRCFLIGYVPQPYFSLTETQLASLYSGAYLSGELAAFVSPNINTSSQKWTLQKKPYQQWMPMAYLEIYLEVLDSETEKRAELLRSTGAGAAAATAMVDAKVRRYSQRVYFRNYHGYYMPDR